MKKTNKQTFNFRSLSFMAITLILTVVVYFTGGQSFLYQSSIIDVPNHSPFDGTTYPVKKVPNWVKLSSAKWDDSYDALSSSDLQTIPEYKPSELITSTDSLIWGNNSHDAIRNAKITYSVPYMGNYLFDGRENAGSHLAVDIKIPMGTPIYSMANGTVIKTSNQSSGFGHHVVVQHNNFPSLTDENARETYYSSYSHLDRIMVSVGDVVEKGEKIATSGETGTATTPHLHFQLDNDNAPWHPYWPFTWADVSAAGLDFWGAVNEGLGKADAIYTTENPMKYVQKYLDGDFEDYEEEIDEVVIVDEEPEVEEPSSDDSNDANSYVPDSSSDPEPVVEGVVEEGEDDEVEVEIVEVAEPPVLSFKIDVEPEYYVGASSSSNFQISLVDQYGNSFDDGFLGNFVITSDDGKASPESAILTTMQFYHASYEGSFKRLKEGRDRLVLEYGNDLYYSDWFEVVEGEIVKEFSDVLKSSKYHKAISDLASKGIVNGYSDGSFQPYKTVSRVEALKLIYEGDGGRLRTGRLPFKDASVDEWYGKYLYTAYKDEVVSGYDDGSFRPEGVVTRAEFYKILLNTFNIRVDEDVFESPFADVKRTDWSAMYFQEAKDMGLIDKKVVSIDPDGVMSRGEVADAIYRMMEVEG